MKKLVLLFLTISLFFTILSGCKKNVEPEPLPKENVYKTQKIKIPNDFKAKDIKFTNDNILLFDGQTVLALDYDGKTVSNMNLSDTDNYACMTIDSTGNYVLASLLYSGEDNENLDKILITKFDKDGNETERIEIDTEFYGKNEEFAILTGLEVDSEGNYYLQSSQVLYILDKTGSYVYETENNTGSNTFLRSIFKMSDGRIAAHYSGYTNDNTWFMNICIPDPVSKSAEDFKIRTNSADSINDSPVVPSDEYDILMCTNMGIYGYDLETDKKTGLFNCLDYGLDVKNLVDYKLLPGGDIITALTDSTWVINEITRYVKIDPSEADIIPEKKTVTLAALNVEFFLKDYIAGFNKNSEEYIIELKSYMEGISDEAEALKKLNVDIMAGNIPDIIVSGDEMPIGSYINKGLIADFYTFMENDPEFKKEDYLQNALTSLERDGKLYEIFPMFFIDTLSAKTSDVGDKPGWTLDEFNEFINTKPDATYIIDTYTKKDFIKRMVQNQFIDINTGECRFDRGEFDKILKISERFPQNVDSNAWDDFYQSTSKGDPIMLSDALTSFRITRTQEKTYFQENLTYKGFPAPYGNGSYFRPCANFSIAEKAKNPDGAWSFIKYMLDENLQKKMIYMPVKLSHLEKMAEEAMEKPYRLQNGEKVEYDNTIFVGDSEIYLGDNTEEDNAKIMELINSTTAVLLKDSTLSGIVDEEIEAYLNGQKSADEVADIIENRINLYLNETN